eukprot:2703033-Pyramimonas_sp.AAC.5
MPLDLRRHCVYVVIWRVQCVRLFVDSAQRKQHFTLKTYNVLLRACASAGKMENPRFSIE